MIKINFLNGNLHVKESAESCSGMSCQSSSWVLYHQSWSSWAGRATRASRCPLHSQQPGENGKHDYHAGLVVGGAAEKVIERLKSNKVKNSGRGSGVMNQR